MTGQEPKKKKNKGSFKWAETLKYLMNPRSSFVIGGSTKPRKDNERDRMAMVLARKPNNNKGVASRVRDEDDSTFPTPKKSSAYSFEVPIIKKGVELRPRTITLLAGTSFFKEAKTALESFKGMVLEKDKKHLLDKRFDLVEELVLTNQKVKSRPTCFTFSLLRI